MGERLNLTISSDASLDHGGDGSGGFAFVIHGDGHIKQASGRFRKKPANIIEAEILSVLNAMSLLIKKQTPIGKLTIETDNLFFVQKGMTLEMKSKWAQPTKTALGIFRYMVKLVNAESVELVHVKAHTGSSAMSAVYNAWCDQAAVAARKS